MNRKFRKQKSLNIRSLKRGLPSRWVTLEIIDQVLLYGKTVREIKDSSDFPLNELKHSERARALSLSDTILRNLSSFDSLINQFLKKGEINLRVRNILRLVTAELVCDNLASHAVVDSAVSLTRKDVKTRHLAGLTNAISRRISDKSQKGLTLEKPKLSFDFAKQLKEIYGEEATQKISKAVQHAPPLDITLKQPAKTSIFAEKLKANILPNGTLRIFKKFKITELEGFRSGDWWVQDVSASMPVRFAGNVAGMRVLDCCAAPGGKTMQLASLGAHVFAIDVSQKRLVKLMQNLKRTKLNATLLNENILNYQSKKLFDLILLDAPCSSSGTIRRNIDLQFLSPLTRLPELVRKQELMLEHVMQLLSPSGLLIFCTCSLYPQEGEFLIKRILERHKNWTQKKLDVEKLGLNEAWLDKFGGLRLRPDYWDTEGGMDGFYIAALGKTQ